MRRRSVISNDGNNSTAQGAVRRLTDITRLTADLIWETDKAHRIVQLSDNAQEHLGRHWSEFLGLTIAEVIRPDDSNLDKGWPEERRPFRERNFTYLHPNGEKRLFQISALPVFDDHTGEYEGLRGIAKDITKLAAQEKELIEYRDNLEKLVESRTADLEFANQQKTDAIRNLEIRTRELEVSQRSLNVAGEQLDSAVQSFTDGFILFDAEDKFVVANDHFYDAHPETRSLYVPGVHFEKLVRELDELGVFGTEPSDPELRIQNRVSLFRSGKPYEYRSRSGRWYQTNHYKTRFGGTSLVRTDVTEIKRSEHKLRVRGDIIESLAEGVSVTRLDDMTLIFTNRKFAEMFGYAPGDLVGKHVSILNAGTREEAQKSAEEIGASVEATGAWNGEILNSRKDGTTFWCAATVSTYEHPDFGPAAISVHSDITDRKKLEVQMQSIRRLEALGQLTGGVAHDFNNLLSIINGNADLLGMKAGTDEDIKTKVNSIKQAVNRGSSLTKRLLAFSRNQPLAPVLADIDDLVEGLALMLHRTLGDDINLDVKAPADTWMSEIDPHQFEDALLNLAINARDAMPDGGNLKIEIENITLKTSSGKMPGNVAPGDYIKLSVSDDGTGMSEDVLEKAMEPFFTTKEVGRGSGLGLSMVYGFAKQSNGHLEVRSEVGNGTTVIMYLPRSDESHV
jgi:PAS domain S-box-containing protein